MKPDQNSVLEKDLAGYQTAASEYESVWASYLAQTHQYAWQDLTLPDSSDPDRLPSEVVRVLDVACGTGLLLSELAASFDNLSLVGIDLTREMLKQAGGAGKPFALTQSRMESLPVRSEQIDCLFALSCLHYSTDPQKSLGEFYRVLKPGGQIRLIVWRGEDLRMKLSRAWSSLRGHPHSPAIPLQQVENMLLDVGFANLQRLDFRAGFSWALSRFTATRPEQQSAISQARSKPAGNESSATD